MSRKLSRNVSCANPKHKNWSRHEKPRPRRLPRYLSTQALNSRRGRKFMSCANTSCPSNTRPPRSPWQEKDAPAKAQVCSRVQVVYTHRSTQLIENVQVSENHPGVSRTVVIADWKMRIDNCRRPCRLTTTS